MSIISSLNTLLVQPFYEYVFLKRALVAAMVLSLGCAPIGTLLILRRMSLMGDALSHSIMPGVAIVYLVAGLSLPLMGLGGFIAGLIVAFLATYITRHTQLKEDASFVSFYLIALALGTLIISIKGSAVDLGHILFGTILGIGPISLVMIASITTFTLIIMTCFYRTLIIDCFDPLYLESVKGKSTRAHALFMGLVVLNMVSAFQAMGTLMALGLMILPAISARFWCQQLTPLFALSMILAIIFSWGGLVISFHLNVPSGPSIIILGAIFYIISLIFGTYGSLSRKNA